MANAMKEFQKRRNDRQLREAQQNTGSAYGNKMQSDWERTRPLRTANKVVKTAMAPSSAANAIRNAMMDRQQIKRTPTAVRNEYTPAKKRK